MRDDVVLKGFSALDVRNITYLACKAENLVQESKSFYSIISQFFSRNRREEMFIIQEANSAHCMTKSAQEISNDPKAIEKFTSQDAHKIGYIAGSEQVMIEQEWLTSQRR